MSAVAATTAHDCAIADVTNRPKSGAFIHDRIAWPHSADSAHEAIVAALVACAAAGCAAGSTVEKTSPSSA